MQKTSCQLFIIKQIDGQTNASTLLILFIWLRATHPSCIGPWLELKNQETVSGEDDMLSVGQI